MVLQIKTAGVLPANRGGPGSKTSPFTIFIITAEEEKSTINCEFTGGRATGSGGAAAELRVESGEWRDGGGPLRRGMRSDLGIAPYGVERRETGAKGA